MKIVIAEDDPVSMHVLKRTINYWGHEILAVPDGAQAWAAMKTWGVPDIALIDWEMPRISGIELCEMIRNDPEKKNIYVILLTSKRTKENIEEGFAKGVDDYVTKPVTEEELKESILGGVAFIKYEGDTISRETLRRGNMEKFLEITN